MSKSNSEDSGSELIEECRYCGGELDTNEEGHFKTPGEEFAHADCLADDCWSDRERVATTEGVFRIKPVTIMKHVGHTEEAIDSYWQARCPRCGKTHETETQAEDIRNEFIDEVLDCCGAEWLAPSDWVEDCDICGEDHRGEYGCTNLVYREQHVEADDEVACRECGEFEAESNQTGRRGRCPTCESGALEVLT